MRELAQSQVGNRDEVGGGSVAAGGPLGLLQEPVHGLDEGVRAVIEHAAHDALEVLLERGAQTLERVEPAASCPADPALEVRCGLGLTVVRSCMGKYLAQAHLQPPGACGLEVGSLPANAWHLAACCSI